MQRMAGLLCAPVFTYLPPVRHKLDHITLDVCTRILANTAPFATLALYRLIRRCETGTELDLETDSTSLISADEEILTDYENFDFPPTQPPAPTHVSDSVAAPTSPVRNVDKPSQPNGHQEDREHLLAFAACEISSQDLA